jgi:hypothetical protein
MLRLGVAAWCYGLCFAQSENKGDNATGEKNYASGGGQFVAALGLHADFGVADLYAVILAVRNRHDKR